MALTVAAVLFLIYAVNVGIGSVTGSPILGDVPEMLLLLAASAAFVVGILRSEDQSKKNKSANDKI
jgi:hypothetical protein